MVKVWLAWEYEKWETDRLIGVFATKHAADWACAIERNGTRRRDVNYWTDEWEVTDMEDEETDVEARIGREAVEAAQRMGAYKP
jgi:hypothetical protein